MVFARKDARSLRQEAKHLRAMGWELLAKEKEKEADDFENIAEQSESETDNE